MTTQTTCTKVSCYDCNIVWFGYCALCKKSSLTKTQAKSIVAAPYLKSTAPKKKNKVLDHAEFPDQPTPITIENFFICSYGIFTEIEKIPDGYVQFFKSRTSTYYTCKKKTMLVRVSDHWGSRIRFCSWYLKGKKKTISWRWQKLYGKEMRIGIIDFADLIPAKNRKELESRHPI